MAALYLIGSDNLFSYESIVSISILNLYRPPESKIGPRMTAFPLFPPKSAGTPP